MADVFISYSRRDSAFVSALAEDLRASGREPWLDTEGIADAEVFPAVLREAIESSDGFLFVISPESAKSRFCRQEVEHALALGKRIVPVVHEAVPDESLPPGIRERQWVPKDDDTVARVVRALDADPEHTREHTRLLQRAVAWDARGRSAAAAPRGDELADAEAWLTRAQGRDPAPTELQAAWIAAGRAAARRRQRTLTAGAGAFGLVAVALLVFALISRGDAVDAQAQAQSRALAARSEAQLVNDPQLSVLLAREALAAGETPEAMFAAQRALDASTLRKQLPSVGAQGCPQSSRLVLLAKGRQGAVTTCDGRLVIQDLASGKIVRDVKVGSRASGMSINRSERTIAVGANKSIALVDVASGRVKRRIPMRSRVASVAYDRNGRRIAVTLLDTVGVVDLRTRRLRELEQNSDYEYGPVAWARGRIVAGVLIVAVAGARDALVTYSPDGPADKRVLLRRPGGASQRIVGAIAVSRDERTLYLGSRRGSNLADDRAENLAVEAASGKVLWRAAGPAGQSSTAVALSPDQKRLAVGFGAGLSKVLDADTGQTEVLHPGQGTAVRGMAFAADSDTVHTSHHDGVIRTWAAKGTEQVVRQTALAEPLKLFRRGRDAWVVTAQDRSFRKLDLRKGRPVGRPDQAPAAPVVLSPDGGTYVTEIARPDLSYRYTMRNTRTHRAVRGPVRASEYSIIAVSSDRRLAVLPGPEIDTVIKGVVHAGRRPIALEAFRLNCILSVAAFSDDGSRLASIDSCGHVVVHDPATGELLRQVVEIADRTQGLSWAPDNRRVVLGGVSGALHVVDTRTGAVRSLKAHSELITAVEFSRDARFLVAQSEDGRMSVWDARTLRLVRLHENAGDYEVLTDTPGKRVVTVSAAGRLRVWDLCDICQDPEKLARALNQRSVRELTRAERLTFGVDA